jgi:nitrogen fixation/metabolism regulation signal transduction histidine kinase
VARRLAHEIKNPLTPIQLSAERLERKLDGKLDASDQAVLVKSVKTIVDQVDAMKRLVNEFRDYARLPSADLRPLDLNALIHDVMGLYMQEPVDSQGHAPIELDLDANCPLIQGDEQQLRQVVHNLLQNAQDACDVKADKQLHSPGAAGVTVKTQWSPARQRVRLTVTDSGPGFAPNILQRAFEPYVTTKAKGTGLGLAVVKKIADEHGARLDISNLMEEDQIKGAQVSLSFSIHKGRSDPAGVTNTTS